MLLPICAAPAALLARADDVPHAVALGLEVLVVVGADPDEQRHLLDDVESEAAQLRDLVGVVGEEAHGVEAERLQCLR